MSQTLRQSHLAAAQAAGDAALYVAGQAVDANSGQTQDYSREPVRDIEETKKRPLLRLGQPLSR